MSSTQPISPESFNTHDEDNNNWNPALATHSLFSENSAAATSIPAPAQPNSSESEQPDFYSKRPFALGSE